jgi:hypothetical protein
VPRKRARRSQHRLLQVVDEITAPFRAITDAVRQPKLADLVKPPPIEFTGPAVIKPDVMLTLTGRQAPSKPKPQKRGPQERTIDYQDRMRALRDAHGIRRPRDAIAAARTDLVLAHLSDSTITRIWRSILSN